MKFNNINEINSAIATIERHHTSNRRIFTVMFKKAVIDMLKKTGVSGYQASKECDLTATMLSKWLKQYDQGLYTLDGALTVSKQAKTINSQILNRLNTDIKQIQQQIDLIKQCEAAGLKVEL